MSTTIQDRDALMRTVTSKLAELPEAQRRVALFLLNHYARVPFMTTTELARVAGTSQSSVTRFVGNIGYPSYAEFITALGQIVLGEINETVPAERFARAQGSVQLSDLLDAEIRHLGGLQQILRSETFARSTAHIAQAPRTVVAGLGAASSIAVHVHLYLSRIQAGVFCITGVNAAGMTELMYLVPGDAALVFAVPRYIKATQTLMKVMADRGVHILLITDRSGTDLAPLAHELMVVPITNGPTSAMPSAMFALGSLLVEAAALQIPQRTMAHLAQFEAVASAGDLFIRDEPRRQPTWGEPLEPDCEGHDG